MRVIFTMLLYVVCLILNAQIISCDSIGIVDKVVYEVDDMLPQEIRNFNQWKNKGWNDERCILHVNADRAHSNLVKAPATIISYYYFGKVLSTDSITDAIDAENIAIQLINSTTKTIKSITFNFSFYNSDGRQVYDTKTGNKYSSLTFSNLQGRTSSKSHERVAIDILNCYHVLTLNDATNKSLFYNMKAVSCKLESVEVLYVDGTKTNKVALIGNCFSARDFVKKGPFAPILDYHISALNDFENNHSYLSGQTYENIIDIINFIYFYDASHESDIQVGTIMVDNYDIERSVVNEEIFSSAATLPYFPGGPNELNKYLASHIRYPKAAYDNNIQGKVVVKFVVEKDGSIGEVKVVQSVDEYLDREAVRVCESLPKFNPGKNAGGEPVRVWYALPIIFRLNNNEPNKNFYRFLLSWKQLRQQLQTPLSTTKTIEVFKLF